MFTTLPESASRVRRDPAGVAWSLTVHLSAIALAALTATGEVQPAPGPEPDTTFIHFEPDPTTPTPTTVQGGGEPGNGAPEPSRPTTILPPPPPPTVPVGIPPVDPFGPIVEGLATTASTSAQQALAGGGRGADGSGGSTSGEYLARAERGAIAAPGNPTPRYPDVLRSAGVEGSVLAEFVVDTTGSVEMATVRIVESDHELFDREVLNVLPDLRFLPAEAGGRRVRQWVRQPFEFRLARE